MICDLIEAGLTLKQAEYADMVRRGMTLEEIANNEHTHKSRVSECLQRAVKTFPKLAEHIPGRGRRKAAFRVFKPQSHVINNY